MSKKKKILIVVLSVVIAIVLFNVLSSSEFVMKRHIANKYDISAKDIEVVDYEKNHFESDLGFLGLDASGDIWYVNRKWTCQTEDRTFTVEYYKYNYYDDYQLKDIFNYCTEYLKENVDPEIVGVEIYSDIIYHSPTLTGFDYSLPWNEKKIFEQKDAEELLRIQESVSGLLLFYKTNDISKYVQVNTTTDKDKDVLTLDKEEKRRNAKYIKSFDIVFTETTDFNHYDTSLNINCCRQSAYTLYFLDEYEKFI